MSQATPPTIVIIGGGFSGTLTAVHLLRRGFGTAGRLVLVNRSGAMARGVAYGTTSDVHVLNVPAGRMSAFDDDPDSFVRFVRARGVDACRRRHVRRPASVRRLPGITARRGVRTGARRPRRAARDRSRRDRAGTQRHRRLGVGLAARRPTHPRGARRARGGKLSARRSARGLRRFLHLEPPLRARSVGARRLRPHRSRRAHSPDRHRPDDGRYRAAAWTRLGASATMTAVSRRGLLPISHRSPAHVPTHARSAARTCSTVRRARAPTCARCAVTFARRRHAASTGATRSRRCVRSRRDLWSALSVAERSPVPAPRAPVLGSASPSHGAAALRRLRAPAHVGPRAR